MCGRFVITSAPAALRQLFGYVEQPNFPPRYNVAPTQPIPVVMVENGARHFRLMRWGLLPSWVKDPRGFTLLINARSETVAEKPAFRTALARRRCLILADGFYEWKRSGKSKKAYYFQLNDESLFAFAGIWDSWGTKERLTACAIVTTSANDTLQPIHNRMPVILRPDSYDSWLDPETDPASLRNLLAPLPGSDLSSHPVGRAVNSVQNDGPELIDRKEREIGTTPSLFDDLN